MLSPSLVNDSFVHFLCNDIAVINQHFRKKAVIAASWQKWFHPYYGTYLLKNIYACPQKAFSAFHNFHIASSMRKSTFEEVWNLEPELLHRTCQNKFRGLNDVNQYVMSYYNICKGTFAPRRADTGKYYTIGVEEEALYADIRFGKHKLICINDNPGEVKDLENTQNKLVRIFEETFPDKSTFEK